MMLKVLLSLLLFIHYTAMASQACSAGKELPECARHYLPNRHIYPELWNEVEPYLLPPGHPIKKKLDALFTASRITNDKQSLEKAGCQYPSETGLNISTVKHPSIKGYVLKLYLDSAKQPQEWKRMIARIEGAKLIGKAIKKHGYQRIMKVAKKWLYPLPENPPPSPEHESRRKNFILIAEDLEILDYHKNHVRWRQKTTHRHLRALYHINTAYGLRDSCRVANIPWSKDKKIAFVDTEQWHQWPVNYHHLVEYISLIKRKYWKSLYEEKS